MPLTSSLVEKANYTLCQSRKATSSTDEIQDLISVSQVSRVFSKKVLLIVAPDNFRWRKSVDIFLLSNISHRIDKHRILQGPLNYGDNACPSLPLVQCLGLHLLPLSTYTATVTCNVRAIPLPGAPALSLLAPWTSHVLGSSSLSLVSLPSQKGKSLFLCVHFFSRWPPGVTWACTNSSEFAAKHFEKRNRSFVFPLKRACPIPSILLISAPLLKVQLCQQVGGLGGQSSFP